MTAKVSSAKLSAPAASNAADRTVYNRLVLRSMDPTRRQLLAGIASAGASRAAAQVRPGPKPRTTPCVCLYSQLLIKVPYDELGELLRTLGVDGCDLSVQPGGHVAPENAGLHLMRAVEAITGVGLDVPVLTTAYTSLADPTIRTVAGVAGEMGVPLFRAGHWKYPGTGEVEQRLVEVQRDIGGLGALARAAGIAVAIHNSAGDNVGAAVWDIHMLIRGMDAAAVGYDFDIGYATAASGADGWMVLFRLVRPRLKMVAVRDFIWSKGPTGWKLTQVPLGEGMVDWPRFFGMLAQSRFTGPISVQMEYQPKDEISAIRRDIDFVKKQVAAAYGGHGG